eukprot:7382209-Prymnesium_polylepis.2
MALQLRPTACSQQSRQPPHKLHPPRQLHPPQHPHPQQQPHPPQQPHRAPAQSREHTAVPRAGTWRAPRRPAPPSRPRPARSRQPRPRPHKAQDESLHQRVGVLSARAPRHRAGRGHRCRPARSARQTAAHRAAWRT